MGADYARYLAAGASKRAITGWTALGGLLPAALLAALGVLAGTVVGMTDPQASLRALLPGWFYPVFLLLIIAGSVTNNVLYWHGVSPAGAVAMIAGPAAAVSWDSRAAGPRALMAGAMRSAGGLAGPAQCADSARQHVACLHTPSGLR